MPKQFIPSVEKGVRAQMERGVPQRLPGRRHPGHPVGGKAHSVDSSDMAFQSAGALALREAAAAAAVTMLEPYDEIEVVVPDEHGRHRDERPVRAPRPAARHRPGRRGSHLVRAHVPAIALTRYAIDLGPTHGTGTFTRTFAHYEPMADDGATVPARA